MAQRLRFILDGDDNLSRVLNHAGDSSARLHRRLNDDMDGNSRAVATFVRGADGRLRDLRGRFISTADATQVMQRSIARFTQDADGRMRDLRGRFLSVSDANRVLAGGLPDSVRGLDDVTRAATRTNSSVNALTRDSNGRLRDLRGRFVSAGQGAGLLGGALPGVASSASSAAESSGGLMVALKGVAVAAVVSLLPALGALVPMLAGAGLAAGTLKLGFAGVGGAMEAAGKGKKEYAAALKKLSPPAREFTKALVGLKKEFGPIGREIQKAMLPGFTRAVKSAGPVVKILGKGMTEMGGAFGKAADGVGRLLKDSGFQDDLQTNLRLGSQFVREMTSSMGPFIRSLLDFGAASGPTLRAFSDGIGGLLSKGLPSMFTGLQSGIPGTAKMLDGLFSLVNDLLGGIGRLAGEAGRTLGPVFGESFRLSGSIAAGAMDMLRGAMVLLRPVFRDIAYGFKSIIDFGSIIAPTLKDTGLAILGAFLPIGESVNGAVGPLQRLNQAIADNKIGILEGARQFGGAIITMTGAAISAAPTIIHAFTLVSGGILTALSGMAHGAALAFGWVPGIGSKLKAADKSFKNFKDNYIRGLTSAESKASQFAASATPKLAAGKLKLNISNWSEQIAAAKAKLKTVPPSKQSALKATIRDLQGKVAAARAMLDNLNGKTATTYIITKTHTSNAGTVFHEGGKYATGGPIGFPGGGPVTGPGTGTSDSIPIMASNGEYMINARSTSKYRPLIEAINSDRLGASGGTGGAGLDVGKGLIKGMADSTSGVQAGARSMAAAVVAGIREELQIASPSKRTKALAKDIGKGLIVGLTGSRDKIKATAKDLAKDIYAAFSGSKDNRLVAYVNRQTSKLQAAAKKRDSIKATIKRATDFAETTRVGAKQSASLGSMFESEEDVTAGGISAKLSQRLTKMRTFASYIKTLAKRGLNKTMLREILTMGPEQGYAYASALAGANSSIFKAINSTQYKINSQADKLGKTGADALYDSGKNASKGFLAGLKSQQKAVESYMLSLAKAMQKALRKALGIRSPARKMMPDGANTTRGFAAGILQGLPHVDDAMQAVAGRVTGAVGARAAGRPAAVAGGGAQQVNVKIEVNGAADPVAVGREFRRVLLELKRVYGVNVNLGVG
ncbi:hypothetical protein ABZU45_00745 [Streptomyces avermitilis]|uniref:hypothetical protein n=1 Tax=Streptomyces avermitilis TaxID=33903 RepID=UPI0033AADF87